MKNIYQLPGGDEVLRYDKSLVVRFSGKRKVLSTGPNNGGYRKDMEAVFNNDCSTGEKSCEMRAATYSEHMKIVAEDDLGLDRDKSTGLSTTVNMDNVSIQTMNYEDFSVTAIVTGSIRTNGGRIGDPAIWHEKSEISYSVPPGTINIILYIDADLSEGALARALVSCTEAKTAAIQELLAPSRYSRGIATGSGTDGTIIICNADSEVLLTNAGKHCKLGEYIGKTVMKAVKEALYRQSGLCPVYQHDVLHRMDRFGVTSDTLWEKYITDNRQGEKRADKEKRADEEKSTEAESSANKEKAQKEKLFDWECFMDRLDDLKTESVLVTQTSLYAHLIDQFDWGMLDFNEVQEAAGHILKVIRASKQSNKNNVVSLKTSGSDSIESAERPDAHSTVSAGENKEQCISWLTEQYMCALIERIMNL